MSDNNSPIVSVIVPLYNAEKYIKNCVNCLETQSFTLFEAIFVNDHSTDESARLLKAATDHDNRFVVASNGGVKGVSAARNLGISLSRGELIYFLDVDDQIQPQALQLMLERKGEHDLICTTYYKQFDTGPLVEFKHEITGTRDLNNVDIFGYVKMYILRPYKYTLFVHCWNKLYRANIIKENNICFNDGLSQLEDVHFNFQYLQYIETVGFFQNGGYIHFVRPNDANASKFSGFEGDAISKCQAALVPVKDYLELKGSLEPRESRLLVDHLFSTITILFFYRMVRRLIKAPSRSVLSQVQVWIGSKELKTAIPNYEVQEGESAILKSCIKYNPTIAILYAGCLVVFRAVIQNIRNRCDIFR